MDEMEEILESMASGVHVSGDSFSSTAAAGYPHFSNYKNRGVLAEKQARRRREFLDNQKTKRSAALALVRHLDGSGIDESEEDEHEGMEQEASEQSSSSVGSKGKRRPVNPFRNQLMFSEWLVHVPENMADEWSIVPCPEGKRVLVVATKGSTRAYAKSGHLLKEFSSALPGAYKKGPTKATVLDCIFREDAAIFYCLDVICWNNHPVFDSDTQFRFYWLKAKLDETPEVTQRTDTTRYSFQYLQRCRCDREEMAQLMKGPFPYKLDGLLFYHNDTHYTSGQTPLVGWLKPFMLPEILNVEIPEEYRSGYETTSPKKYIADFDEGYGKKHGGRQYGGKKKGEGKTGDEDEKVEENAMASV